MKNRSVSFHLIRVSVILLAAVILFGAVGDVNRVACGTGHWLGEYSLKWGLGFFSFVGVCLAVLALSVLSAYFPQTLRGVSNVLLRLREKMGLLRWLFILALVLAPIRFFQYTYWGVVFTGISFRLFTWLLTALLVAYLLTPNSHQSITNYESLFTALLVTGAALAAALPLVSVTSYPFSLEWSEGNRLWDYSIMFGRDLYIYPADKPLVPFLDFGRQLIGGLPFLLPRVTLLGERLWVALVAIVPYMLLGWSAFAAKGVKRSHVFLAGLWAFLFLRQGPIHPPLVMCAILVALTWRRPLWISIPAIALASWFASISRATWIFAPGMWAGMLVMADELITARQAGPSARTWRRAILLGLVGAASGYFIPKLVTVQAQRTVEATSKALQGQSLLWYRLLPNSTYDLGILGNLLLAALPILFVMAVLYLRKEWRLTLWQGLAIALVLLAFLAVGLVASTKIGGGADLHNMDMFLIGTMFAASLAWSRLAPRWTGELTGALMTGLLLMVFLPSLGALKAMTPILRAEDLERLKVLTGREDIYRNDPNLLGFLPTDEKTERALNIIGAEVQAASQSGAVLFMDQRQLLTFGLVPNVPLVPEYDKKYLMDRAMANTPGSVFPAFYADLKAHRFALIVTDPLRRPVKDSDYSFGEENNAWVKWVAGPVLCYYRVKVDLNEVRIQLLEPRTGSPVCDLPE